MEDCLAAARWLHTCERDDLDGLNGLPIFYVCDSVGTYVKNTALLRLKDQPQIMNRVAGPMDSFA